MRFSEKETGASPATAQMGILEDELLAD